MSEPLGLDIVILSSPLGLNKGEKGEELLYSYLALQRLVVGRVECARQRSLRKGS